MIRFSKKSEECGSEGYIQYSNKQNSLIVSCSYDRLGGGCEPYRYSSGSVYVFDSNDENAKHIKSVDYDTKTEMMQAFKELKQWVSLQVDVIVEKLDDIAERDYE